MPQPHPKLHFTVSKAHKALLTWYTAPDAAPTYRWFCPCSPALGPWGNARQMNTSPPRGGPRLPPEFSALPRHRAMGRSVPSCSSMQVDTWHLICKCRRCGLQPIMTILSALVHVVSGSSERQGGRASSASVAMPFQMPMLVMRVRTRTDHCAMLRQSLARGA